MQRKTNTDVLIETGFACMITLVIHKIKKKTTKKKYPNSSVLITVLNMYLIKSNLPDGIA